jgi:hypothetical protein
MGTELRSNLLNIFRSALIGNRDKDVEPSYTSIADEHKAWHSKVDEDVQSISWYMEHAKTGTSTELLCKILVMRNQAQLRGIVKLYRERYHTNLSDALAKIYSGDMKLALTYIAKGAEGDGDGVDRDADLLHDAMKGMGTKDEELTRRQVVDSTILSRNLILLLLESYAVTGIMPGFKRLRKHSTAVKGNPLRNVYVSFESFSFSHGTHQYITHDRRSNQRRVGHIAIFYWP